MFHKNVMYFSSHTWQRYINFYHEILCFHVRSTIAAARDARNRIQSQKRKRYLDDSDEEEDARSRIKSRKKRQYWVDSDEEEKEEEEREARSKIQSRKWGRRHESDEEEEEDYNDDKPQVRGDLRSKLRKGKEEESYLKRLKVEIDVW